ncbi:MAG TPA: pitrilysin family protein [Anaeromyxobacteraceae bacterium]|nr:pitrilysin family protein [Anaeromyxobacteraceae bacterium]
MRRLPIVSLLAAALVACAGPRSSQPRQEAPQQAATPAATPPPAAAARSAEPEPAPDVNRHVPERGPPPDLNVPPQHHFKLSNGLAVRFVEYHRLPIVALHLVVDAGAVHDPSGKPGVASFTAAMMTEGTKRRSATDISDALGALGASLAAGASMDAASLSASGLSRHLDPLLEIFADVLLSPTFPQKDFVRVQDTRLVTLVQQRDQPGAVASKAFTNVYWGAHPYGHWLIGTEQSVKATRREDLARYHATWWKPGRAELVVVGDVSQPDLRAKLEKALARWKGAPPAVKPFPPPPPPALRTVLIEKPNAPQAYLVLGMPGMKRSSPEYVPTQIALHTLGGGSASRLFRNLREEKGLTYGVYAMGDARKLAGVTVVAGSVKADQTGVAMKELLAEIEEMREHPVTVEELETSKNALALSLPADFSTAAGIAAKLADEVVHGLPDDYWERYRDQVMAATPEAVQAAARQALDPEHLTVVMVADSALVKPQLAGLPLGDVQVRPSPTRESQDAKPSAAR